MSVRWKIGRSARLWGRAACSAAVAGAVFAVIPAAQATPLHRTPRLLSSAFVTPRPAVFQWKPGRIIYSGDGGALLAGTRHLSAHLVWTSWTSSEGRARGADWHNNCKPDCAGGKFTGYPVTIRVYRPRRVAGFLLFTRMTTTYTGARPPDPGFRHRSITYKLDYDARHNTLFWPFP